MSVKLQELPPEKDGDVHDGMIWRLRYCAISWVEENPEVMPLLEADYTR